MTNWWRTARGDGMRVVSEATPISTPEVVELLEELLSRARAGTITGLAVATVGRDSVTCYHANRSDFDRLVGQLELVKARVIRKMNLEEP